MTEWQLEDVTICDKHAVDVAYINNGDGCPHCSENEMATMRGLASAAVFDEPIQTIEPMDIVTRTSGSIYRFTIEGQPIPKARPRLGKKGYAYTPKKTKNYEALVKKSAMLAIPEPLQGDLFVHIDFYRKGKVKADIDNMVKAILDGLNKVAYADDKQVRQLFASVEYEHNKPCADVIICDVDLVKLAIQFGE